MSNKLFLPTSAEILCVNLNTKLQELLVKKSKSKTKIEFFSSCSINLSSVSLNKFDLIILHINDNLEFLNYFKTEFLRIKLKAKLILIVDNKHISFAKNLFKSADIFSSEIKNSFIVKYIDTAVKNIELNVELQNQKKELKTLNTKFRAEINLKLKTEALIKSNIESLKITLNSIGDGVIATDLNGNVTLLNPVAQRLTGWKESEAKGKHFSEVFKIVNAHTRITVENPIVNVLKYGKKIGLANNTVLISKNGKEYQISDSAAPIFDKNKHITGVVLVFFDITDKYEYQQKIKNLYNIIESSLNEIFIFDADTYKFTLVNQGALKNLGYQLDEMLSLTPLSVAPEYNSESFKQLVKPLVEYKTQILKFETFHKRKNGTIYPIEVNLSLHKNYNKSVFFAIINDITERKKTENLLKDKERFQETLISNLPGFVYNMKLDRNWTTNYISSSCEEILGYKPSDFISNKVVFNDLILEKYRDYLWEKWQNIHLSKEVFEEEFEVRKANGEIIWVWERGRCIFNENNEFSHLEGYMEDITKRKLAELKNEKLKNDVLEFFENDISADFITSIDGTLKFCNNTYLKLFGFKSKEEAYNYPVNKLYKELNDRQKIINLLKNNKKIEEFELNFVSVEGIAISTLVNAYLRLNDENQQEIFGFILDITNIKKAEEKIKIFGTAIEQSYDAILITNTDGVIEYANKKLLELTGYTKSEIINKKPNIFKSGSHNKHFYEKMWSQILSGNTWEGEILNKKKSGELYWELTKITPLKNENGVITNFVATKEDITEKKKYYSELILAKEKAEESDKLKSAFLANMSHEIRTPMNGILGFTQLLKKPNLENENLLKFVNIIEHSGNRLLNIINDIIDISKIEAGQVEVIISETNLNQQLDFIFNFFQPEVSKKNVELICIKELNDNGVNIFTDKEKLYAILTNLVKNAIKFTNKGFIEFGYTLKQDYFEFFVKDTGVGISKDKQKVIFERFRQGSEEYNRDYEGSGLGLTITKSYVELLGGKIWLKSELNFGSTFFFTIPYNTEKPSKSPKT